MPFQRNSQQFEAWPFVGAPLDPQAAVPYLNERLTELSARLSLWAQYLSFGPVLGGYHALHFLIRDWDDASTAVAVGELSPAIVLPAECVPLAFSVSTINGSATVQLRGGTTELLTADLDSAASPPYVQTAPDFTARRLERDASLNMRVETITGSPLAVFGVLWVNQMPKVTTP